MSDVKYKAEGQVQVNSRLNVRQGNGTKTAIVGKLTSGAKVKITHKTSDNKFNDNGVMRGGYKIEYKGSSAYVCSNYVKIIKEYKEEENTSSSSSNAPTQPTESDDIFILTGEGEVSPNIKLDVRQVVSIQGIGKYLSGNYYVEAVTFKYDNSSGFSQSVTLSKNAFGSSINAKPKAPTNTATNTTPEPPSNPVTPPSQPTRTHTLKKGDTLWGLATKYYGKGTKWTEIAKANGISVNDDKTIRSLQIGRVLKIPYL